MEARIIGPASELGAVESLPFFDGAVSLSRQWSTIKVTPEQLEKLEGNRFVEIRGKKDVTKAEAQADAADATEDSLLRQRLGELGVDVPEKATPKTLRDLVEKAENAKADADAEAEAAQAEADAAAAQA